MNYRSEIDGLRAIAVLPVILFHAGFTIFSGGFVGVDIFFVISGYLITSIILHDLKNNKFSLINFYERRARRILPALFFVMFACLPFAWQWLLPEDMKRFSQSLVAVSFYASNFLFWITSNYFESASELKPLLHTWSLAVEEQYYLFFPLLLMFFWSYLKKYTAFVLVSLAVISLIVAQIGSNVAPTANYFLLHSRAWELLIGALAAYYLTQNPEPRTQNPEPRTQNPEPRTQ
jgi:peptidoglycan/LPS O-acetylase OafA/YrhL